MRILIASNNEDKIKEISEILSPLEYEFISLKDAGIDIDVNEDKDTFMDNAYKKAIEIFNSLDKEDKKNTYVLADDTGLSVDYLNGAPGVLSARYSGFDHDYKKNNEKLLKELEGVPLENRNAKFITAMVLLGLDKEIRVTGEAKGRIILKESGLEGFGYDPLFYSFDLDKTFAEAKGFEKNSISHRGRALEKLLIKFKES